MMQFKIDKEVCVQCGECAADCPYSIIEMVDGFPQIDEGKAVKCVACQHCFAVCKPGALSVFGLDPADSLPLKNAFPDTTKLETLIMGRRSVRRYREKPVDGVLLDHILDVVRHAPTGLNRQATQLTVVDDPKVMDALRKRTYDGLRKKVDADILPEGKKFFAGISAAWEAGKDILFRGAPHLLVTSAPAKDSSPVADTHIAMSYFELLATAHGIGTVWNGYAKWALVDLVPEAGAMLQIPKDHIVGYVMAFGMPAVRYHRTVQRPGGVVRKVTI